MKLTDLYGVMDVSRWPSSSFNKIIFFEIPTGALDQTGLCCCPHTSRIRLGVSPGGIIHWVDANASLSSLPTNRTRDLDRGGPLELLKTFWSSTQVIIHTHTPDFLSPQPTSHH